jgi:chaperonin cofactor prefoldin
MPKTKEQVSEEAKGTKKTTSAKRITNQMVWSEISRINSQISAMGNQESVKNLGDLVKKMDEGNQQALSEISKMDAQLTALSAQVGPVNNPDLPKILSDLIKGVSLINTQIAAIRDQLTELRTKLDTAPVQNEPKVKETKRWYEFWKS